MTDQEEDVPRFSLRRGARFEETFREGAGTGDPDEEWLVGLKTELGGAEENDAAELPTPAEPQSEEPVPVVDGVAEPQADGAGAGEEPVPDLNAEGEAAPQLVPDADVASVAAAPSAREEGDGPPPSAFASTPSTQPDGEAIAGLGEAVALLTDRLASLEEALARAAAACTVTRMVLGQGEAALDHPSHATPPSGGGKDDAVVVDLRQTEPPPPPAPGLGQGRPHHQHSAETALSRLITPLRRYGSVTLRDLLRPE